MVQIGARSRKPQAIPRNKLIRFTTIFIVCIGYSAFFLLNVSDENSPSIFSGQAVSVNGEVTEPTNFNSARENDGSNVIRKSSSSLENNAAADDVNVNVNANVNATPSPFLKDLHNVEADNLWNDLLLEAEAMSSQKEMKDDENKNLVTTSTITATPTLHVMEVGMHTSVQCIHAARRNLYAHCVEPSPSSYTRINERILKQPYEVRKNVKFYQMAASDASGLDLEFVSDGGTGDHVGGVVDLWTMTKKADDTSDVAGNSNNNVPTVNVKSVAIDDIIHNNIGPTIDYANTNTNTSESEATSLSPDTTTNTPSHLAGEGDNHKIDKLFLLKVDTQGHEPSVFAGLKQSIREHRADFIMTEYWPKGIDFMNDAMGPETECQKGVEIMQLMSDAGYTLYTMSVTSHMKAPWNGAKTAIRQHNGKKIQTPIDSLRAHCMWFYDLERDPKYHNNDDDEYKMGYWTDVLAVAPGAKLGKVPVSATGKIIASHLSSN